MCVYACSTHDMHVHVCFYRQFILDFLEEKQKLIVFAHHRAIVDIIGVGLEAKVRT